MTEEVLNKIEELMNEFDNWEDLHFERGDEEMRKWALHQKMAYYTLLQEFGYDYDRDGNGKIKVIKEV